MKNIFTILLLAIACSVSAQTDPAAGAVLDRFSAEALSAPSVSMKFDLRVHDKVEDTRTESEGSVVIKNNMYRLDLTENIIWFDGSAIWTLAPEVKEVTVTLPDPDDDTFFSSPSGLFDMYREGFKYRLLREVPEGSVIDLYPEDPSDTDFSLIRLVIDGQDRLVSAEYRRKDGIDIYIDIKEYNLRESYPDQFFSFDSSEFPGVDIIDMR